MRGTRDYLGALAMLHRIDDVDERRGAWRQSVATLAAAVGNQRRAVPLEGLNPEALRESVGAALRFGLVDDLDWLSGPAAAAALYELAAALPPSDEKRELGRRVLARLHKGNAATFVALATQLALGSARALSGPSVRARVALCLDMPIGSGARADGLALALISRRELSREWLSHPSTGSLSSRRLAARLLERAAREAARRAAEGDDSGLRVFGLEEVRSAWDRLLADRESLVWRHIASARGLLASALPELDSEIHENLGSRMGITEWRRAAASLAASIALRPQTGLTECHRLLDSAIFERDRGIAIALLLGLPRAAEQEPEAVEELLEHLIRVGGLATAEALVDLRRERIGEDFGTWAAQRARAQLRDALDAAPGDDDGYVALMESVIDDLGQDEGARPKDPPLRDMIAEALEAFAVHGPTAASEHASKILEAATARVEILERSTDEDLVGRRASFRALRELDAALFETDALANLLALGENAPTSRGDSVLGGLFQRISHWLIRREGRPIVDTRDIPHFTMRRRRLRTLLHFVDADGQHVEAHAGELETRRRTAARVLLVRVRDDLVSPMRRTLLAATARALDGLARDDVVEVTDVLVAVGFYVPDHEGLATMAEASMIPDVKVLLASYAALSEAVAVAPRSGAGLRSGLDALRRLTNDLPVASSPRVEALRAGLLDVAHALESLSGAGSLLEVVEILNDTPLSTFEGAVQDLARLIAGARRRMGESTSDEGPNVGPAVRYLDLCLERALRGPRDAIDDALQSATSAIAHEMPAAIGSLANLALDRLSSLPADAPRRSSVSFIPAPLKEAPLPGWMPPGRTLGGFYVTRAIGAGAVGSVFVARRAEEKHDPTAECFALKVPDYTGAVARTLSEEEFLQVFRMEAGALLALPQHPNIARFVTFDVGARPKPILVMELVEGPSLERLLELGEMTSRRSLDLLEGIATGLEAMHGVGLGHLDVKPSNIIIRDPDGIAGPAEPRDPVLVDFGLAGRHVRAGCGTAEYGAPEVWTSMHAPETATSMAAAPVDVYAFGCLMYELIFGLPLFNDENEMATLGLHMAHDGTPPLVAELAQRAETGRLAKLLQYCLRQSPGERISMTQVRQGLDQIRPDLEGREWPLTVGT